jgi:hypothetical protein
MAKACLLCMVITFYESIFDYREQMKMKKERFKYAVDVDYI